MSEWIAFDKPPKFWRECLFYFPAIPDPAMRNHHEPMYRYGEPRAGQRVATYYMRIEQFKEQP